MGIRGTTRVAGVIGDPVTHSLSPIMHNAAFEAAGLDWVYVACTVPKDRTVAAIRGAAALGFAGMSVTMPGKETALEACDAASTLARELGAVNCITFRDGEAFGDNTDGDGFLWALRREGVDPNGARLVVLGAGGAARAIAHAAAGAGARVTVVARRPEAVAARCDVVVPWDAAADVVADAAAVVNATPVGMDGTATPIDPTLVPKAAVVIDALYRPLITPLVAALEARGVHAVNGIGMLVGQGAVAFERWTGVPAPIPAMEAAIAAALGH